MMMQAQIERREFCHQGLRLSFLDTGGSDRALVALHAHWMEASTYAPLAAALTPSWRVIALDQRGHGFSDHAKSYSRNDYLGDLSALLDHLKMDSVVLLGNSLGGVNAYQFAARMPRRVKALIVEDIGVTVDVDTSFTLAWAGTYRSRKMLAERIGPRLFPYLQESLRRTPGGWRLAFEPREMLASQLEINGDHWEDWLASRCPALVIRGRQSRVTVESEIHAMASRRPETRLVRLDGGHVVHQDNPGGFLDTVREFLDEL